MGMKESFSYYGRMDELQFPPKHSIADDLLKERKKKQMEDAKEMEERIKRHITECKREVIKRIDNLFKSKGDTNGNSKTSERDSGIK
jgi:hypothetical protein